MTERTATTRRASLADVAKQAGVSVPTAARILAGGNKEVWKGAAARAAAVRKAAEDLGYRPSHAARTLAAGRTSTIALAVSEQGFFETGIYLPLLHQALRAATAAGYHLLPVMMGGGGSAWRKRLIDHQVGGVLVTQPAPTDLPETLVRYQVPSVLLNLESNLPLPQVQFDENAGIRQAIEHLAHLGHRSLVFWDELPGLSDSHLSARIRRDAVQAECSRLRIAMRHPVAFKEDVARCPETAVLTGDRNARDLLQACRTLGRRVPEELSVIGINDEYGAEWTTPPLTSIHVPVERMIQRGLELLLELMQGATTSHMVELLPEHLVIRETTAPPTAWFSAQS